MHALMASSGRQPIVVGKPHASMMAAMSSVVSLDPERCCMVGDRLDTDIVFGQESGMKTLLVLSGVTNEQMRDSCAVQSDFWVGSVGDLYERL